MTDRNKLEDNTFCLLSSGVMIFRKEDYNAVNNMDQKGQRYIPNHWTKNTSREVKILKVKTSGSETIMVGGSQLEEVSEFTYLGSIIDDKGGTGEDIKTRIGQEPIDKEIGRRKWRWIGHTLRKPTSSITRHALQWNPQGKRGRGRPQITWRRQVEEDMKRGDISWREAARNAQDRDKWKSVVCGLYPEKG
ncbi:hypothetical protein RRG08_035553 [Elysia crispata]|uniref:Uncharacterized protein n=1 Tax=Elysia crispata TaxID=231223 RepID=A0AAE1B303_9GAST|nr:hypothetical protein RRG08_035553 [Elysia crispata]